MTLPLNDKPPSPKGPEEPLPEGVGLMIQNTFGTFAAHAMGAAVRLGIVEAIGGREVTSDQVAATIGSHPGATLRLMRALAALRLLDEGEPGVFRVTQAGMLLNTKMDDHFPSLVRFLTDPLSVRAFETLTESVRTGKPTFHQHFGQSYFDYVQQRPELSAEWNKGMGMGTREVAELLPERFDFSGYGTVIDVGGGNGTLLASILRHHKHLKGVVYDTAAGLAEAGDVMREAGVADRFTAVPGDFFASIPTGGDLYILKSILHDWEDQECLTILHNLRTAIGDGTLLVMDAVFPDAVDRTLVGGYLIDLNMLVNVGGQERTAHQFRVLFEKSGFAAPTIEGLPMPGSYSLLRTTAI